MSEYRKLLMKFYEGEVMPITAQAAAWLNRFVLFLESEQNAQQKMHLTASGAGRRKHPAKAVKQIQKLLAKHGGR